MPKKITNEPKIDAEKWYTLNEIATLGLLPWCKTISSVRTAVESDRAGRNDLKAAIVGQGVAKRYNILGKNIIQYLVSIEDGSM